MNLLSLLSVLSLVFGLSASGTEWYKTAAFYQIYPQTFFDDVGKGTGTFSGIQSKLDYLKDLGIDCLWLTPVFKSSFNAYGYDITDYKDLDPRYGNQTSFKALIDAVHKKGMKIIVDFVPNHCGKAHEFFQKSIKKEEGYDDWFIWTKVVNDEATQKPSNWQRIGGAPGTGWTKVKARDNEFYYAQFHPNMPDFNLRNQKVLDYLTSVMEFWLKLDIDGFRVDAISHGVEVEKGADGKYPNEPKVEGMKNPQDFGYLDHKFTQDQPELFEIIYNWRKFLNEYQVKNAGDARIMMTESYSPPATIKKYYQSDDKTKDGAHLPFNFQMINKIKRESNAKDFVKMVTDWFEIVPEGKVTNWVIGNHDQSRIASRFGEERVDIMNTLVTMLPGTSVTYYGEEIGMYDSCAKFETSDHNISAVACDSLTNDFQDSWARSPMQWDGTKNGGFSIADKPWIPISDNYRTINVKAQQGKEKSHLEIYKSLLKLRKNEAILQSDKFEIKALGENSFAFKRELNDKKKQSILVVINFGGETEKIDIKKALTDLPDLMKIEIIGGDSKFTKHQQISISGQIELQKYESIVAFYNSSSTLFISKTAFIFLIVICLCINSKL